MVNSSSTKNMQPYFKGETLASLMRKSQNLYSVPEIILAVAQEVHRLLELNQYPNQLSAQYFLYNEEWREARYQGTFFSYDLRQCHTVGELCVLFQTFIAEISAGLDPIDNVLLSKLVPSLRSFIQKTKTTNISDLQMLLQDLNVELKSLYDDRSHVNSAVRLGSLEIVLRLVGSGSNYQVQNKSGCLPVQFSKGSIKTFLELLEYRDSLAKLKMNSKKMGLFSSAFDEGLESVNSLIDGITGKRLWPDTESLCYHLNRVPAKISSDLWDSNFFSSYAICSNVPAYK